LDSLSICLKRSSDRVIEVLTFIGIFLYLEEVIIPTSLNINHFVVDNQPLNGYYSAHPITTLWHTRRHSVDPS
jgi:hypothetical protein